MHVHRPVSNGSRATAACADAKVLEKALDQIRCLIELGERVGASRNRRRQLLQAACLVGAVFVLLGCAQFASDESGDSPAELPAPLVLSGAGPSNGPPFRLPSGDFRATVWYTTREEGCSAYLELRHTRILYGHRLVGSEWGPPGGEKRYVYDLREGRHYIYANVYSISSKTDQDCLWHVTLEHLG